MSYHFSPLTNGMPACGRGGDYPAVTTDVNRVTCGLCVRMSVYRSAMYDANRAQQMQKQAENAAAQRIITGLASHLNKWANEAGHCDTYDDAIQSANEYLSTFGVEWPERGEVFEVEVKSHASTINAEDMDAAYDEIASNIRDYIVLS